MIKSSKTCRTCLSDKNIFIPLTAAVDNNKMLFDCFKDCLDISIARDENLPQQICFECNRRLVDAQEFKKQCQESEGKLRTQLQEIQRCRTYLQPLEAYHMDEEVVDESAEELVDYLPFECDECFQGFKYNKNLLLHQKYVHNFKETEMAAERNNQFANQYECKDCDCGFVYFENYKTHLKRHRDEKQYQCSQCEKQFYSSISLQKHFENTHLLQEGETVVCSVCQMEFIDKDQLRNHLSEEHRIVVDIGGKKTVRYTEAGQKVYQKNKKTVECTECGKVLKKIYLKDHMFTHTGTKPYKCSFCDRRFTQRNALRTHLTLHVGKKFECTYPGCDKLFARPSILKVHLRNHETDRSFLCKKCGKTFQNKSHLNTHEIVHVNATPFKCKYCEKTFGSTSTRDKHQKKVHLGIPYQCPDCPKKFLQPRFLRSHCRSIHKFEIESDYTIYKIKRKFVYENYPEDGVEENIDENEAVKEE